MATKCGLFGGWLIHLSSPQRLVYETYSPWDASPESELDPDSPEAEAADLIADGWDPDFVATLTADKSQPDTPNGLTPEAAELIADGWDPAFVATSLAADESSEANDDADLPSPESVAAPEMASGEKITSPRQPEGATAHKVRAPACAIFDAFDSDPASDEAEAGLEPQHGAKDFSPAGPSKPEESRTSRVRAPAWAVFDPLDEQPKHSTPSTEAKTAPKKSKPQRRRSTGAKAVGTKPKRTTP